MGWCEAIRIYFESIARGVSIAGMRVPCRCDGVCACVRFCIGVRNVASCIASGMHLQLTYTENCSM